MHLINDEQIIKVIHHHPFPHFIQSLKVAMVGLPFYFFGWFVSTGLTALQAYWMYVAITGIFAAIIVYNTLIHRLDHLIITNQRIVHVDWKNLFSRKEHEAELSKIQTINTQENGFIANLAIFDYGNFELETSSTGMILNFEDAPDPEGIKQFLYHLMQKPSKICEYDQATENNTATINKSTFDS